MIRAHILLDRYNGNSIRTIAAVYDITLQQLSIKKYLEGGTDSVLFDNQCKGCLVEITDDAVAWIIDIACQRPADLGYSQKLWTLKNLHHHIQEHAVEVGYPRLSISPNLWFKKSFEDQISSRIRSNIIAKNEPLGLKPKCMMFYWYINRSACSSMMKEISSSPRMNLWYIRYLVMKSVVFRR